MKGKEKLPPALEVKSRLLTEEEYSKLDMLPATIEEAIVCASNSSFLKESNFAKIAENYIETIKMSI